MIRDQEGNVQRLLEVEPWVAERLKIVLSGFASHQSKMFRYLVAQGKLVLAEPHASAKAFSDAEPVIGQFAGELQTDSS